MSERRLARVDRNLPSLAIDDHRIPWRDASDQAARAEYGGQAQRTRHDGGVTLLPPHARREAMDDPRIHQRDVGRRKLVGDHNGALSNRRKRAIWRPHEVAEQTQADVAYVLDPSGDVGIGDGGEVMGDLFQLSADRRLGIAALIGDPAHRTPNQARARQHLQMGLEQIADVADDLVRQRFNLAQDLACLPVRPLHGLLETGELGGNGVRRDSI